MRNVVSLVLGGGKGTRLYPLTKHRAKPAVPLAGKYRLIDIPISNCINSGLNRIYVLTQFLSVSLHRHIRQTYHFDRFSGGFVEILAAQQTADKNTLDEVAGDWYQGTADAVRKNQRYLEQYGIEHVLILSGDQLYRMDFLQMIKTHLDTAADVTIAGLPVDTNLAKSFGIMRLNDKGQVIGFVEKPKTPEQLASVRTDAGWLDQFGIKSNGRECLASMGIYLFKRDVLLELLETHKTCEDFGRQIFPEAIKTHSVQMHPFDGYWEDIGTVRSFYEANLELASPNPPFEFVAANQPIYTRARYLPPNRIQQANISRSFVVEGCVIGKNVTIENSIIGLRTHIGDNVTIKNSVIMGADYYQEANQLESDRRRNIPHVGIADGAQIYGAMIDKNARIGKNVKLYNSPELFAKIPADGLIEFTDVDGIKGVALRDHIILLEKDGYIKDGWTLGTAPKE